MASVALDAGVPDKYAMERGGWSRKETMLYRYQHTSDPGRAEADAAINAHFEQILKTS